MSAAVPAVTDWVRQAACAATPDLSWTEERWRVARADVDAMAAVCGACPVVAQCREYVTATAPTAGFWAGAFRERWQVHTTAPLFPADVADDVAVDMADPAYAQAVDLARRARRRDAAVVRRREGAEYRRQARLDAQQRAREELEVTPVAGLRRVGGGR